MIGIVIPNYAKKESDVRMLGRALKSIQTHNPDMLTRTVVIDDGSPIGVEKVAPVTRSFGVTLIPQTNCGFSGAVNRGLELFTRCKFQYAILMNSDVELLAPPAVIALHNFALDPKLAIIGGLLFYPTGKIQAAGFTVDGEGKPIEFDKQQFPFEVGSHKKKRYVFGVTAALCAVRLGTRYFSKEYGLGYEDVELCGRTWSEGDRVLYDPVMQAIHHESASRGYFPCPLALKSLNQWETEDFRKLDLKKIESDIEKANAESKL